VFAGQKVGVKEVTDKVWLVSFIKYDLGFTQMSESQSE
jgi:putative transposase